MRSAAAKMVQSAARFPRYLLRLVREMVCHHRWEERLILGFPPNTHRDVRTCSRCEKSEETFRGTREQWYRHNFSNK